MMLINENDYFQTMQVIKEQIQSSQYKAIKSVNKELILLYW